MINTSGSTPLITLSSHEVEPLREAMRDLQVSVAAYYAKTGSGGELGHPVRSFLNAAQTLNDLLTNQIEQAETYKSFFNSHRQEGAALLEGVKFARNISQHVLHIVRPSSNMTLVGGELGFRFYAQWDDVPPEVVSKLRRSTQELEPRYRAELEGKEVTGTMMDTLRFFARVAPQMVHRDRHGEWTGFPLLSQPGINTPLHPEEPQEQAAAMTWLENRRPGGDCRVVCGQVTVGGVPYIYGHAFVGRLSFSPFVETVQQVNDDITRGFPYLGGNLAANFEDVTDRFPTVQQGAVLRSRTDLSTWTTPVTHLSEDEDWHEPGVVAESWAQVVGLEASTALPGFSFNPRRARRLNALIPPS